MDCGSYFKDKKVCESEKISYLEFIQKKVIEKKAIYEKYSSM